MKAFTHEINVSILAMFLQAQKKCLNQTCPISASKTPDGLRQAQMPGLLSTALPGQEPSSLSPDTQDTSRILLPNAAFLTHSHLSADHPFLLYPFHVAPAASFYTPLSKKNALLIKLCEIMCCLETTQSRILWHRWLCNYPCAASYV